MKACTRCGATKPRSAFYVDKRRKSGLFSWCKECFRAHCREADAKSGPRQRTPEKNASDVARLRRWREANPERMAAVNREAQSRRRAGGGEKVDYEAILSEHGMVCHICTDDIAGRGDLHFDHVVPLAKGGPHIASNIRPSHAACNLRKRARILEAVA